MKLTSKCLRFYDEVHQALDTIGSDIAKKIGSFLFCESFEVRYDSVTFHIWQSGCRGAPSEGWDTIEVPFQTLLLENPALIVATQYNAKLAAKKALSEAKRLEEQERTERAMLEKLQQKYKT